MTERFSAMHAGRRVALLEVDGGYATIADFSTGKIDRVPVAEISDVESVRLYGSGG